MTRKESSNETQHTTPRRPASTDASVRRENDNSCPSFEMVTKSDHSSCTTHIAFQTGLGIKHVPRTSSSSVHSNAMTHRHLHKRRRREEPNWQSSRKTLHKPPDFHFFFRIILFFRLSPKLFDLSTSFKINYSQPSRPMHTKQRHSKQSSRFRSSHRTTSTDDMVREKCTFQAAPRSSI